MYTTEHDATVALAIANFQSHDSYNENLPFSEMTLIGRLEKLVSAAVLIHLKDNHVEGQPQLMNYHVSLAEGALAVPFSYLVDEALKWTEAKGEIVESVDSLPPESVKPKHIDEWLAEHK